VITEKGTKNLNLGVWERGVGKEKNGAKSLASPHSTDKQSKGGEKKKDPEVNHKRTTIFCLSTEWKKVSERGNWGVAHEERKTFFHAEPDAIILAETKMSRGRVGQCKCPSQEKGAKRTTSIVNVHMGKGSQRKKRN